MSLTLVTALFDAGRGTLGNSMFKRPFESYKSAFAALLVATRDTPIIIFCEPSLDDWIAQYRDGNYQIIHQTLDSIRAFRYFDRVKQIRSNPNWYSQSDWIRNSSQFHLDLYLPTIMLKPYWLLEAVGLSTFASKHYAWIDAALIKSNSNARYLSGNLGERLAPYLDKMLYLAFIYRAHETHGFLQSKFDEYAGEAVNRVVRGGLFGSTPSVIKQTTDLYDKLLERTLADGYLGTEENILTLVSYLHPELCNVQVTDATLFNFFRTIGNFPEESRPVRRYVQEIYTSHNCKLGKRCAGHIVGVSNVESRIP